MKISQSLYNCQKYITIDEIMIKYKGHFCDFRQYMPGKPVEYGIKVWCAANSQSRYIWNLQVYLGAQGGKVEPDLGMRVVLELTENLSHRGHIIVTDNFFTSPRLLDTLLSRGFWGTGTVKRGRVGMPPILKQYAADFELTQGTLLTKMHRSKQMAAIVWQDA